MDAKAVEILNELLSSVSDAYDKSPGSFIYDALAPAAIKLALIDESIDDSIEKLSIENLSGAELAQRIRERTGIIRRTATRAIGNVTLTGTGNIQVGNVFETSNGTQFRATQNKLITSSGVVTIEAVVPGPDGVVSAGTINLFPVTLTGFTAVTNAEPTQDGFDAESDNDLLQRYYDKIQTPTTSGNVSHYINWAKEISGVGDVKVFPLWDGDNTVKVLIIDSDRLPASNELVSVVQEYIDPSITGRGNGVAPIGAFVTVESAIGINIDIVVDIVLSTGYTIEQAEDNLEESLKQYLRNIAFVEGIVSYAKVGAAIINTEGIEDYTDLTVNGGVVAIEIEEDEVAVLGSVILDDELDE